MNSPRILAVFLVVIRKSKYTESICEVGAVFVAVCVAVGVAVCVALECVRCCKLWLGWCWY
jgi:hypothetical protein